MQPMPAQHQVVQNPSSSAALSVVASCPRQDRRLPLGRILQDMGVLSPENLMKALEIQAQQAGALGDILVARGMISDADLTAALSRQFSTACFTADSPPPDPALIDRFGVHRCLAIDCVPWRIAGDVTIVATAHPARFARHRRALEHVFGPVAMVIISQTDLHQTITRLRKNRLKLWAETCVSEQQSCRSLLGGRLGRVLCGIFLALLLGVLILPAWVLTGLTLMTAVVLIASSVLKLAALLANLRRSLPRAPQSPTVTQIAHRKPIVSVMVPLFKEPDVIPRLINRLSRLTWHRDLLDILLVVEEHDHATRAALARQTLPRWMRVILVPDAKLKTKPRALNFAMLFARGSIIGVYDAEDAPEPDQIHRVVRCFQQGPDNLACVQGVLDFYNSRANWLSRCFTIEYAVWFRVILPGIQRLGLAVPLGGTTLFFRRDILEQLGGWDAHNVTEDADLGIRLARHGYFTQLLPTVTYEEANCHPLAWVKQRSRWLKGYAVTWLVHMREPRLLWRQLGPKRFWGVQVMFLGTLVQSTFAPLLWSFWLILIGLGHPLQSTLGQPVLIVLAVAFFAAEVIGFAIAWIALRAHGHRYLRWWILTLPGYFPLAVLAVYKALWEIVTAPFYWDKTPHGQYMAADDTIQAHVITA